MPVPFGPRTAVSRPAAVRRLRPSNTNRPKANRQSVDGESVGVGHWRILVPRVPPAVGQNVVSLTVDTTVCPSAPGESEGRDSSRSVGVEGGVVAEGGEVAR